MNKVAKIVESRDDYAYIFQPRLDTLKYSALEASASGLVEPDTAMKFFEDRIRNTRRAKYIVPRHERTAQVLTYGSTGNNRREFDFIRNQLQSQGISVRITNIADHRTRMFRIKNSEALDAFVKTFRDFLSTRVGVSRELLYQLVRFTQALYSGIDLFKHAKCRVFLVSNDHAPVPVGFTKAAEHLGITTAYVQHAEVSQHFPPLDYDYSFLRNRHSRQVYESIARIQGKTAILPRATQPVALADIEEAHRTLLAQKTVPTVIYPSRISDTDQVAKLFQALRHNPNITSVQVKLHPRAPNQNALLEQGVAIIDTVPSDPHVAVCGNSAVVVELVAQGNLTYHAFSMDQVSPDFYGFVRHGLTVNLTTSQLTLPFMHNQPVSDSHRTTIPYFSANILTPQNQQERTSGKKLLRDCFERAAQ